MNDNNLVQFDESPTAGVRMPAETSALVKIVSSLSGGTISTEKGVNTFGLILAGLLILLSVYLVFKPGDGSVPENQRTIQSHLNRTNGKIEK